MNGPLKLGLIGAGRWGRIYIRTLEALADVRLHRLASTNPDSRALVSGDCIISNDWRDVATAEDLDGVIIASPPDSHAKIATAVINNGIPVLIEKPLTLDAAEAAALLALAREKAATVLVDHIHLYHPAYVELKNRGLGLGAIHHIRSTGGDRGPFRPDISVLWDRASHDVSMCLDLMGEKPERVSARQKESRNTPEGRGEIIAIELNFAGGVTAHIEAGNLMAQKKRFLAVHYDHRTLIYNDESDTPLVSEPRPSQADCDPVHEAIIPVAATLPLKCVLQAFVAAIGRGESELSGLELGVRVVEVLGECDGALQHGIDSRP